MLRNRYDDPSWVAIALLVFGTFFGALIFGFACTFLAAFLYQWAWNVFVPHVTGGRVPLIDYWQALGLCLLTGLAGSYIRGISGAVDSVAKKS